MAAIQFCSFTDLSAPEGVVLYGLLLQLHSSFGTVGLGYLLAYLTGTLNESLDE